MGRGPRRGLLSSEIDIRRTETKHVTRDWRNYTVQIRTQLKVWASWVLRHPSRSSRPPRYLQVPQEDAKNGRWGATPYTWRTIVVQTWHCLFYASSQCPIGDHHIHKEDLRKVWKECQEESLWYRGGTKSIATSDYLYYRSLVDDCFLWSFPRSTAHFFCMVAGIIVG